jgi:hypothetical protein
MDSLMEKNAQDAVEKEKVRNLFIQSINHLLMKLIKNMHDQYNTNIYGYWQFTDILGLGCGIEKYDLVYIFKVKDNMAHAVKENGKIVSFHETNVTKNYFERPSYKYHKKCELGIRSAKYYRTLEKYEHHKNDCHKCQMYKFKNVVKRFKKRKRIK